MMKSRLDNRKNKNRILYIIFVIVFIIANYFMLDMYRNFFANSASYLYGKIFLKENSYSILIEENSELKNKVEELKIKIKTLEADKEIVDSGLIDIIKANSVLLSNKTSIIYSDILLNKGADDGVSEDALVFVAGFLPVGHIKSVNSKTSILELFSFSGTQTDGLAYITNINKNTKASSTSSASTTTNISSSTTLIQDVDPLQVDKNVNSHKAPLTIKVIGDGAYGMYAKVPDNIDIGDGDNIYLKSNPDYIIGTVASVNDLESEKEKIIYIKSNYSNLGGSLFFIQK